MIDETKRSVQQRLVSSLNGVHVSNNSCNFIYLLDMLTINDITPSKLRLAIELFKKSQFFYV